MGCAIKVSVKMCEPFPCCSCGTYFSIQEGLRDHKQETGGDIKCPNGCNLSWNDSAKKKIDQIKEKLEWERRKNQQALNRERTLKGQITKLKKRTGNGVCPCCNRTFKQLARHMKCKHPEYSVV